MNKRIVNRFSATVNTGSSTLTDEHKDIVDIFKRVEITNPAENYHSPVTFEFDSDKQIQELIDELTLLKNQDYEEVTPMK